MSVVRITYMFTPILAIENYLPIVIPVFDDQFYQQAVVLCFPASEFP